MKKLISTIIALTLITPLLLVAIDFVRFPECYFPSWENSLKNDIANGDEEMIEYYERNYIANNRILFE